MNNVTSHLAKPQCPYPPSKSEVVPMKVLAEDEKYQQANLEILECFKLEANPSANPHVITYKMYYSGTPPFQTPLGQLKVS